MSNPFNMDQKLKEQAKERPVMSELVRNRIDATLESLPETSHTMKTKHAKHPSRLQKGLRRTAAATIAAGVLGVTVFASGFVSPAMADSLRNIPLVGSLFSSIEADMGLKNAGNEGLTTTVNSTVAYQDVKLEVLETVYDGTRAAFLVQFTAPNLNQGKYDNGKDIVKLSNGIDNVFFNVNGSRQDTGLFYSSIGETQPNMLLFEQVIPSEQNSAFPDQFDAEIKLTLQGIDHEFKLNIPFTKSTDDIQHVLPDTTISNGLYTAAVTEANVTPITTRISTTISLNNKSTLTAQDEEQLRHIGFAIFDDQGRQLTALSGEGLYEGNQLRSERIYATTSKHLKYLIVKPFEIKDDFTEEIKDHQFIKGMDIRVNLNQ
ncbi:MAG TPA: DUF4179 domain-containing protein [Paenibacillus sp.]|uniref:DUF4179 domain-containing protein n=1 Tax=Paenibacillus TaxID=44249 RepID=UPI000BA10519|nr:MULTISPECIES: DUF4179 domain-containing protein [Paenibacillus]OZQ65600.1 hypothetical protein CA599_20230 [Paenibacillus taichungensis]HBU85116.1 DUF4179 domain-containing protein [Paenibacillus sp.]